VSDAVGNDVTDDAPDRSQRPDSKQGPRGLRRRAGLLPVLGAAALAPAPLGFVPVFAPLYTHLFQISTVGLGGLLAMVGLGGALATPVATTIGDRLGHARMLRVSLIGAIAGAAICSVAAGYTAFAVGLLCLGLFSAALFACAGALGIQLFPGKDRRLFSLNLAVSAAAGMLWPAVAQTIVQGAEPGTPAARLLSTAVPFGSLALLLLLLRATVALPSVAAAIECAPAPAGAASERSRETETHGAAGARARLFETTVFLCCLVGVHAAADVTLVNWMPTFLNGLAAKGARYPAFLAPGYVLSLYSGAYLASRLLLSLLPHRLGRNLFLIAPGIVGGVVACCSLLFGTYVPAALGYVIAAFFFSFEYPAMVTVATQRFPNHRGALIGLSSCVAGLGSVAATYGVGAAAEHLPLRLVLAGVSLGFVAAGLGGAVWSRRLEQIDRERSPETSAS